MNATKFSMTVPKFQQIIKTLGEITDEAVFNFEKKGLHVSVVDPANVAMGDIRIPKSEFETYEFEELVKVGVDFTKLERYGIFSKTTTGMFEFSLSEYNESPNPTHKLKIMNGIFESTITMMTVDSIRKEPKLPKYKFNTCFGMESKEFKDIIKRAKNIDDFVFLETVNKCVGFTRHCGDNDWRAEVRTLSFKGNDSKALYSLDYLCDLAKPIKSESVMLKYNTDLPITIEFTIGEHGICKYLLAPRIESEG